MTISRIVLALASLCCAACGGRSEPAAPPPPASSAAPGVAESPATPSEIRIDEGMLRDLRVTTATVESRRGDEEIVLLGELAVDEGRYAEVGVPVSARVNRLLVGVGDPVAPEQVLAELQSVEAGRARSQYLAALGQVRLAENNLERKRGLAAERIAPAREVQEAEAAVSAARAELRAAAAGLTSLGLRPPTDDDLDGSSIFTLVSPIRGTVIDRHALRGQMLEPGKPAFEIADLSTLWLTVHAYERDAVRIQHGSRASVAFAALPGQHFTGNVTMVGRQVSTETRTIDVRIEVGNRANLLRPGMSASASLPIGTSDTPILAVPVAAVQRVGENWSVFVPKATGHFEIRAIGRGRDLGSEVEVLSGLRAGETIVVDGAFLLKSQAEKGAAGHEDH